MTFSINAAPDGGWGWVCVLGEMYCAACVLGTQASFGIVYIALIDYFDTGREEAAWIGSLTSGLTLLTGPLSSAMTRRIGIQKTTAVGTLLAFSGCFISWFATGIPYLYVSYGIMNGIGLGLILVPCIMIVVQYFDKRRALANAIGSVGNGLGTLVLPPIYTYLLNEYGWRGTLLLLSGIILNCLVCAVIFVPPSYLKSSGMSSPNRTTSYSHFFRVLCNPCLALYTMGTAIAYLGYIVPFVHLPDMSVQRGIEKNRAAYLISVMGISNMVGRITFGWISDFPCTNVILVQGVSLMLCSVSTALCPHLTQFYTLAVYSVIYGAFIGVFISVMPVVLMDLIGLEYTGDAVGIILCLAGIVDTVASPIAGWLFDTTGSYKASFYLAACPLFLAGSMIMMVNVLHKRQTAQEKKHVEIRIKTLSQVHVEPHTDGQYEYAFEQTYI